MAIPPRTMSPSFRFKALNPAFQSDPRRILGQQLQQQGLSSAPVRTPLQGLGRLSSALIGAYLQKGAIDRQVAREDERTKQIMGMIPQDADPALRTFAMANPDAFANAFGQSLLRPTTSSEVVDLGGNLRGVQTTQTGPFGQESTSISNLTQIKPTTLTTAQRNASALGLLPGTVEYNKYIRDVTGKSGTNINVSTGVPFTKEQEEVGKKRAARVEKNIFEPATNSQDTITNINQALALLEANPDVAGLGQESLLSLKESLGGLVSAFGVDPKKVGIDLEKVGDQQIFRSIINKLVLDQTSKLKGALSNKELDFSGKATAQLGSTVEANKVILAFQKQAALKSQIVANEASKYFAENSTYGKGKMGSKTFASVDDYLNAFKKNNEVFGPALIREFNTLAEIKAYEKLRGRSLTTTEDNAMVLRARQILQLQQGQ